MTLTFWITNGVDSNDEYMVVVSHDKEIKCNHCYNTRMGFVKLGASYPESLLTYAICRSCLYNPATGMVNNLFIAVSKNKNPERFERLVNECENKDLYLEEILKNKKEICIYCGNMIQNQNTKGEFENIPSNYHVKCFRKCKN